MKISGNPTPTDKIIYRLRAMAEAGGMLTRDRIRIVIEAADRLEDLDERVAIMMEQENAGKITFTPAIYESKRKETR